MPVIKFQIFCIIVTKVFIKHSSKKVGWDSIGSE